MTNRLPRVFLYALPGGVILIACVWLITHMTAAPPSTPSLLKLATWAVFSVGLVLSALFHRSKLFHALLLLAITSAGLSLGYRRFDSTAFMALIEMLGLLLPANLLAIAVLPETGILARSGLVRAAILAAECGALFIGCRYYAAPVATLIARPLLHRVPFDPLFGFPQLILLMYCAVSVVMLAMMFKRRFRPTEVGVYWTVLCTFVALRFATQPELSSTALLAAAVVLNISLLETFYAMAYVDELTDLPSRRCFNDAKLKLGSTYTVAMVDVDHFKTFNDTFGHHAGDHVLRMVARRLEEITGGGNVYRYGGEEFVVLFPGKYVDESYPHLERVRKRIEENPFRIRSVDRRRAKPRGKRRSGKGASAKEATVTVSVGVAGTEGCRRDPDLMVRLADQALYRAKSCGRNCTMISDPELVKA